MGPPCILRTWPKSLFSQEQISSMPLPSSVPIKRKTKPQLLKSLKPSRRADSHLACLQILETKHFWISGVHFITRIGEPLYCAVSIRKKRVAPSTRGMVSSSMVSSARTVMNSLHSSFVRSSVSLMRYSTTNSAAHCSRTAHATI